MPMNIRDRVKELRRVKAGTLRPHPRNWRIHPDAQRDALRGVLAEIGYADALVARELPDGSLELIDGHLRAETTPEADVPVLVVDLDDREAAKLLAVLDPLAGLAETDRDALAGLAAEMETQNEALREMIEEVVQSGERRAESGAAKPQAAPREVVVPECFQVVVECRDEDQQRAVFERLSEEGYSCRLLTL